MLDQLNGEVKLDNETDFEIKLELLEYKIDKLSRAWLKPAIFNAVGATSLLGLFIAWQTNEINMLHSQAREMNQDLEHMFIVRYENLNNVMILNKELYTTRINNTDNKLEEFKDDVKRELHILKKL